MFKFNKRALAFILMVTAALLLVTITPIQTGSAATGVANGWYKLKLGGNYLNIDTNGNAELRQNGSKQTFHLENKGYNKAGNAQVTLKLEDGRYLGMSGEIKDGVQVKVLNKPYVWNISFATGGLRPPSNPELVVNASGKKYTDGTKIILWTSKSSTPDNARFVYVPKDAVGWPFVPSDKNMTNGKIKSGWAYIISHDNSKFRVNDDKTVSPSKRYNYAFYFEHLGNNKYYIHAAYGGYLAPQGKVTDKSVPVVISETPFKWFLDGYNEGGVLKFAIVSNDNSKHVLKILMRTDDYSQENIVALGNTASSSVPNESKFVVSTSVAQNTIPNWWLDYKAGKPAPTEKVEEPEDDGYIYYDKLNFAEEAKLPITTTRINYNLEFPTFKLYFPNWESTVKEKLLSRNERGTYLHAIADGEYVTITKYSASGKTIASKDVKYELPIFGDIFSGKEYNYIAFGQNNKEQKDSKETIRIVKYDKEFNRISSVSVKGNQAKAIKPLDFTARFAENGNQLILHTARTRYKSSDGVNHQSNLDVYVNTDTMKLTYVSPLFPSNHVSHSFNTYVQFDSNVPVFLDHGDGAPRSVVIQKADGSSFKKATMFNISGPIGANYTGVTVGGFEVSKNNYVTALATINQAAAKWGKGKATSGTVPSNEKSLIQRDIVVSVLPRNFNNGATAKTVTIAKYIGTSKIASKPQLLKINNNKFAVLWAEFLLYGDNYSEDDDEDVAQNYAVQYIDENGKKIGGLIRYQEADDFYAEYVVDVTKNYAPSTQVTVLAYPVKTTYKVGEGFDIAGLNAVNYTNGKVTNINKDITFYTSNVVQLTKGRKFTAAGTKVVEIRYKGKRVSSYTINVTK